MNWLIFLPEYYEEEKYEKNKLFKGDINECVNCFMIMKILNGVILN